MRSPNPSSVATASSWASSTVSFAWSPCGTDASEVSAAEKADKSNPGHVAAPLAGTVSISVSEGDYVEAGATVATIEAMKMEASITAPGPVTRIALRGPQQVEGSDLLMVIDVVECLLGLQRMSWPIK